VDKRLLFLGETVVAIGGSNGVPGERRELHARASVLFWQVAANTDVFLVPANWPAARRVHWQALLQARAIENQAYVVGVNRVGEGGGLAFSGDSRIVDPLGEVLASAAHTESIVLADVSSHVVADVRQRSRFLADRR